MNDVSQDNPEHNPRVELVRLLVDWDRLLVHPDRETSPEIANRLAALDRRIKVLAAVIGLPP